MLKRKIEKTLAVWKNCSPFKALCIFGARQIGKTTSVEEFAQKNFRVFIKIDFIRSPEAKDIFDGSADPDRILEQIELFSRTKILPQETLILLDEIQECPNARTAIKYLVQDQRCRFVETGSLLGVKISQIPSVPVGFEELVNMYPLDFEEFLWALGVSDQTISELEKCFNENRAVPKFVHEEMKRIYLTYLAVGGMPEVVSTFVSSQSVFECTSIQKSIWQQYAHDVTKYANRSEISKILEIFDSVPSQLNSPNLRFILSKAAARPKPSFIQYEGSLSWLTQAGIVLPCFNTSEPVFPLKLNEKRRLFRLYVLDTGLLCSQFDGIQLKIIQQDTSLNWGAILENGAAQALVANGFELYYFNQKNLGELDFVIQEDTEISLIEMKSGKDYRHHPALDAALKKGWSFRNRYVFCSGNVETENEIRYLPWYMMIFLKKSSSLPDHTVLNLEALDFSQS